MPGGQIALARNAELLVGAVCLVSFLGFLGAREVEGVRERRLAGSAADIDRSGRWLLPRVSGEPRILKPPLADWLAAGSLRLLGRSELAFRLPFALAGIGVVGMAHLLARALAGRAVALKAALILATTLYFVSECNSASADLLLALFTASSMACFWLWKKEGRPWSRWWWLLHLSLAFGLLSKGPVALVLVALPVVLELWASGRWRLAVGLRPWWGLLIVILLVLPWPIAVWLQVGEAPTLWLLDMKESLGGGPSRGLPGRFYHLLHWPSFTFPWTVLGLAALGLPLFWRRPHFHGMESWPDLRFAWFWLAGDLVFLSTWGKQPIHYLLPLAAPAAIIEGALCERMLGALSPGSAGGKALWASRGLAFSFVGLGAAAGSVMAARAGVGMGWAIATGALLVLPAVLSLPRLRSRPQGAFALLVLSGLLGVSVYAGIITPERSRRGSDAAFARAIGRLVPRAEPVFFTEMREALPFYADRDFRKVPCAGGADVLHRELAALGQGCLLTLESRYRELKALGGAPVHLDLLIEGRAVSGPNADFVLLRFAPAGSIR